MFPLFAKLHFAAFYPDHCWRAVLGHAIGFIVGEGREKCLGCGGVGIRNFQNLRIFRIFRTLFPEKNFGTVPQSNSVNSIIP